MKFILHRRFKGASKQTPLLLHLGSGCEVVTGAAASATAQHVAAHVWGRRALKGKEGGETVYLFPEVSDLLLSC